MTREEEMADIRRKRAELDRRYRELKVEGFVESGNARITRKASYKYRQNEEFILGYKVRFQGYKGANGGTHYVTLAYGTRGECVDAIPQIMRDLQALYDAVKGECNFV